jgi:hypothetical protein
MGVQVELIDWDDLLEICGRVLIFPVGGVWINLEDLCFFLTHFAVGAILLKNMCTDH